MRAGRSAAALLLLLLSGAGLAVGSEDIVVGCGGFVKSDVEINYSLIEVSRRGWPGGLCDPGPGSQRLYVLPQPPREARGVGGRRGGLDRLRLPPDQDPELRSAQPILQTWKPHVSLSKPQGMEPMVPPSFLGCTWRGSVPIAES